MSRLRRRGVLWLSLGLAAGIAVVFLALGRAARAERQDGGGSAPWGARVQSLLGLGHAGSPNRVLLDLATPEAVPLELATPGTPGRPTADLLVGRAVPFPAAALDQVDHDFFALTGGHALEDCQACHAEGRYQGTSARCVACHAADEPHAGAYGPECAQCHSVVDWVAIAFDHRLMEDRDCQVCHTPPPFHYPGRCAACHLDTARFANAVFDHGLFAGTDCAACHRPPPNHFVGPCSACHANTASFADARFDHSFTGAADCAICHAPPPGHFPGACRACHVDTGSFRNANFSHAAVAGTDCGACHAPPPNHFAPACRSCHQDTANFRNASFNHAAIGATDCGACHASPPNHYAGECRVCHQDTASFRNVNFSHAGLSDCAACHTPPPNHFPGQCSGCHSTDTFTGASFNHSFPLNHGEAAGNCGACHTGPPPAFACTLCHDAQEMADEHAKEEILEIGSCLGCHPGGEEPDD